MRLLLLLFGVGLAALFVPASRARASVPSGASSDSRSLDFFSPGDAVTWQPSKRAAPYLVAVENAEAKHGLPGNLLARLIQQESNWDPHAFNPSGATGIAQIVPRWHPNVDANDPFASIDYAAGYLRQLFDNFGTWERALAAYNWGWGNVDDWVHSGEQFAALPLETQNYVTRITGDVPV